MQVKTESSGGNQSTYSEYISSITDTSVNNGWRKISATFTVPSGLTRCYVAFGFKNAKGTAFFDAVQVEAGDVTNDYNLVENAGFEQGNIVWSHPAASTDGHYNSYHYAGALSYRLYGKPFTDQSVSQVISLSPNAAETDTYILSAWAKADALSNQFHKDNRDKKFGIGAKITYSDGTVRDKYIPANFAVSDWQFVSGAFTLSDETSATKVLVSITVYGIYKNQSNKVNFDNISLLKEDVPSYTYNSKGNLVSSVENAKGNQKMSYSANDVDMTKYENAVSDVYTYTYDGKHNLTSATSKRGVKYNYSYDDYGNALSLNVNNTDTSKTVSITSSIVCTDNGSLVASTTDAAGGETEYAYQSNTGNVASVTDAKGNTTSYTYDSANYNLTQTTGSYTKVNTTDPLTTNVKYAYDSNNRLTKITAKSSYTFTYDSNGNLTTASAGEKCLVTNTYNLSTNALTSVDYGNYELLQHYEYDNLGRLIGLKNNTVKVGEWKYDGKDRIAVYSDIRNTQKHLFSYDVLGRFTRESVLNSTDNSLIYASEYSYDRNNNINKIGIVSGNTGVAMSYTYGQDNLPDAYTAGTNTGAYSYDSLNRLSKKTSNITPAVSYIYAGGTSMVSQEYMSGKTTTYWYDANGNINAMLKDGKRHLYTYDEFNRLIEEKDNSTEKTTRYTYDRWGNMSYKKVYDKSDNLEKTYGYKYTSSDDTTQWNDLLVKYNGKSITYDAIGNPTNYMGATMYWEGRTLTEQIKNGTTITYSYDSSDMRTSKTVGGVKHNYYYVQGKLMYEDCPSYKLFYSYDAYGNLSEIKRILANGTTENFGVHCNIFGDVTEIYYEEGMLAAKYTYDSWGKLLSVTDMANCDIMGDNDIRTQNSIRYRGYVYDEESQLYYLQSRYYDPETCRFINADDVHTLTISPKGLVDKNLYSYCDCNPIVRVDIEGDCWFIAGAAFGFIVSGAVSLVAQYVSTGEINPMAALVNSLSGMISGALATTGICLATSVGVSAVLGSVTYIAEQAVKKEEITVNGIIISGVIGIVSGFIGGKGMDSKNLTALWKSANSGIERELRRANVQYASKQIAKYTAQKFTVKVTVAVSAFRYIIAAIHSAYANIKYNK